jgi:hypothetical protein
MADQRIFTLKELEAQCSRETVEFCREQFKDPQEYRNWIEQYASSARQVDTVLEVIRSARGLKGWKELLATFANIHPSSLWTSLPRPQIARDSKRAAQWLRSQATQVVTSFPKRDGYGILLTLDTLNMDNGAGHNVTVGFRQKCNLKRPDLEWVNDAIYGYPADHLIESLVPMKRMFRRRKSETRGFADYWLFLSYSGLVLLNALERAALPGNFLAVWGFHDGDLFVLARQGNGRFERLVRRA